MCIERLAPCNTSSLFVVSTLTSTKADSGNPHTDMLFVKNWIVYYTVVSGLLMFNCWEQPPSCKPSQAVSVHTEQKQMRMRMRKFSLMFEFFSLIFFAFAFPFTGCELAFTMLYFQNVHFFVEITVTAITPRMANVCVMKDTAMMFSSDV